MTQTTTPPPTNVSIDMSATGDPDFDFRYKLYDTILLLGGKKEIADLLTKSLDLGITDADVDMLRNYNCDLMTKAKDRLAHLHTIKIRVAEDI